MQSELRVLFRKEAKHLLRSRAALLSSLVVPSFILVGAPLTQFFSVDARINMLTRGIPEHLALPAGITDAAHSDMGMVRWVFPLLVALGGLLVPAITAVHTVIAERDNRTIELLAALPVRLSHVLFAKFATVVIFCVASSCLLLTIDAALIVPRGWVSIGYMASIYVLLIAAMAYSASASLVTTLIAKDFRTANNINGMLLAPLIGACIAILTFVPGETFHVFVLAGLFAFFAAAGFYAAIKIVSFERLLQ